MPKPLHLSKICFGCEPLGGTDWGDDVDWEDGDDSISDKMRRPKEWDDIEWNAESRPRSVEIKRSSNPEKKLMAVFEDKDGKKIKEYDGERTVESLQQFVLAITTLLKFRNITFS